MNDKTASYMVYFTIL